MNPDDIQKGSLCVLDTNILLYAEQGLSKQCQGVIKRCSIGEILVVLPQTVWHELTHKLMLMEAVMAGRISGSNLAGKLSRQPGLIKELELYKKKILALKALGLGYASCREADFLETALKIQRSYGLLTNDAVILATAVRLNADVLVTADAGLRNISEMDVAVPSDI